MGAWLFGESQVSDIFAWDIYSDTTSVLNDLI